MSEWREISGYEGHYQVSRSGQVRSLKRGLRGVMKQSVSRTGYRQVNFYLSGKVKHHYVHRLVAGAFIGPIPEGREVNYKDGDKANNKASNLEIVTAKQNIEHAILIGLLLVRGELSPRAKLKADEVRQIRELKGKAKVQGVADRFGVSARTIYFIWAGKTWRHVA